METDAWIDVLDCKLAASKHLFRTTCDQHLTNSTQIRARQVPIIKLRSEIRNQSKDTKLVNELFSEVAGLESTIAGFSEKPEEWEAESSAQLLFTEEWSKPLNQVPLLLPALSVFKIYLVPFFAVFIPLIAWILPYVIVRFFFGIPLTIDGYLNMFVGMWLGGKTWASLDFWGQMRILFQTTWTAFGVIQGIMQPVQQAIHLHSIAQSILERGELFRNFAQKTRKLFDVFGVKSVHMDNWPLEEPRQLYAYVRDHPQDIQWILNQLAELEVQWRIASSADLCFVKIVRKGALKFKDFFDPSIAADKRVTSSFESAGHSILTGPNKGGKSSVLRGLFINVWLAQTYGVAFAAAAELVPFRWIRSGLRLADLPGSQSLFERELSFATEVLRQKGTGFLVYDECFHSTNPPDGEKTAALFLKNLWERKNIISIVSTHVFTLVEGAPRKIQKLCVPAQNTEFGIEYSFSLAPGLCTLSSVEELYVKFGFPSRGVHADK